jgi:hypothetical protein
MPVEDGVEKVLGISNDEDRKSRVSCVGLTVGAVRDWGSSEPCPPEEPRPCGI